MALWCDFCRLWHTCSCCNPENPVNTNGDHIPYGQDYLKERVEELQSKVKELQRQITIKDEALHKKNLELDALHRVWCTGNCELGVHRYEETKEFKQQLDKELVKLAIGEVKRMAIRAGIDINKEL